MAPCLASFWKGKELADGITEEIEAYTDHRKQVMAPFCKKESTLNEIKTRQMVES